MFLEVWDPIGIYGEPNAQDEYDSYIGRAFELLVTGATDRELEEYLLWIVDRLGMDGSRASQKDVIGALRAVVLVVLPDEAGGSVGATGRHPSLARG